MAGSVDSLEGLFHEPNRLALMTELCGSESGLSFTELKARCGLTDGNLSRHLQTLERAGAVSITKEFVGSKPRTTVFCTDAGRQSFLDYLAALELVLRDAAKKLGRESAPATFAPLLRPKKA